MQEVIELLNKKILSCKMLGRKGVMILKGGRIERSTMLKHFVELQQLALEIQNTEDRKFIEIADSCLKYKVGFEVLAIELCKNKYLIGKRSEDD